jgi:hypothetical protein
MHCPVCDKDYQVSANNCIKCGYPFEASKDEQSKYISEMHLKKSSVQKANSKIKSARFALWIIGGLFVLSVVFQIFQSVSLPLEYYLPNLFFGLIFIGFGFLTYRLPIISTIIPLALLTAYWIFLMSQDLSLFFRGILYKIASFSVLCYALYAAIDSQNLRKENEYLENL